MLDGVYRVEGSAVNAMRGAFVAKTSAEIASEQS